VGAQNPAGGYTVWGAGFGFSLSTLTTATTETPVQLAGTGVTVTVTSLPTNADMRLQVKHFVGATGTTYCAIMTTATQTITWTSFNTMCWSPSTRRGADRAAQHIELPSSRPAHVHGWLV